MGDELSPRLPNNASVVNQVSEQLGTHVRKGRQNLPNLLLPLKLRLPLLQLLLPLGLLHLIHEIANIDILVNIRRKTSRIVRQPHIRHVR